MHNRFKDFDTEDRGIALLEMVVAVALLLLTASFMVMVTSRSLSSVQETSTINDSSIKVEETIDKLSQAKNCYEVNKIIEPQNFKSASGASYTITTTLTGTNNDGSTKIVEKCSPNTLLKIHSVAESAAKDDTHSVAEDGKHTLYFSSTTITILGS